MPRFLSPAPAPFGDAFTSSRPLSAFAAPLLLVCLGTFCLGLASCSSEPNLDERILEDYIAMNSNLAMDELIACAAGKPDGFLGTSAAPTDVFFYPIEGASDFRYFEANSIADSLNFSAYQEKDLADEPIFNGYLWKFNNTPFTGERMGVVTYKTPGKLHVCTPIRLKTNAKPTEVNPGLLTVTDNGTNPTFSWSDGLIDENVIYFQVISDTLGNLISGTYTVESEFTFYDLSNVVLNITDADVPPMLEPATDYRFTMMAVSEDNWVNLFVEQGFRTE